MTQELKAHIFVFIATFLVAGSFIISQKLSGIIDPISITLYRFVMASLLLAPFILLKKEFRKKIRTTFFRALIISLFYSIFFIGLFTSLEYTTALNTGTIFTLTPLITAILTIFIFKEKIEKKQYLVYLFGILGTIIVIFKGDLEELFNMNLNKGDIIFLFSIFSMALYSISAKYFYKESDVLIVLVFLTLLGGSLWMFLFLFFMNIPLNWDRITGEYFIYLLYLSLIATLITAYLYQKSTIILGPKKVMSYIYLNPAAIAILLFIYEFQVINIYTLIGILISSFSTFILLKNN